MKEFINPCKEALIKLQTTGKRSDIKIYLANLLAENWRKLTWREVVNKYAPTIVSKAVPGSSAIQWLIKKATETETPETEMGKAYRAFSLAAYYQELLEQRWKQWNEEERADNAMLYCVNVRDAEGLMARVKESMNRMENELNGMKKDRDEILSGLPVNKLYSDLGGKAVEMTNLKKAE